MTSIGEHLLVKAYEGYARAAVMSAEQSRGWADHLEAAAAISITTSTRAELEP